MRWDFWLAQPKTGQTLQTVLRLTAGLGVVWALGVAYGLWSTNAALAQVQAAKETRGKQLSEIAARLPGKRRDAAQAERLRTTLPTGAGGAEFTGEISQLAEAVGAQVLAARIGSGDPAAAAAANQANPNEPRGGAAAAVSAAPADSGAAGAWKPVRFECGIVGTFGALTEFLDRFSALPRVVEISAVQVTRAAEDAGRLQLKLTGTLYGLGDKR